MTPIVMLHVVGDADLGLRPGDDRTTALDLLASDAETALLEATRADHGHLAAGPLVEAYSRLHDAGYDVQGIVMLGTDQHPPHSGDTYPIAQALAGAKVSGFPPRSAVRVPAMSVAAFSDAARGAVTAHAPGDLEIAAVAAGGAKSAFTGMLAGIISTGRLPFLVEANRAESDPADALFRPNTLVNVDRWLARHRIWTALERRTSLDQDQRAVAADLARLEMLRPLDTPDRVPADTGRVDQMFSECISDMASGEANWPARLLAVAQQLNTRVYFGLDSEQRTAIATHTRRWRQTTDHNDEWGTEPQQVLWWAIRNRPDLLRSVLPAELEQWVDCVKAVNAATREHRHNPPGGKRLAELAEEDHAARQWAWNRLHSPELATSALSDPAASIANAYLELGRVISVANAVPLGVRIAGTRDDAAGIEIVQAIDSHQQRLQPGDAPRPRMQVVASEDTRKAHDPDQVVVRDFLQTNVVAVDVLEHLRVVADDHERQHPSTRIGQVHLYLNQGTKAMNVGTLLATTTFASEIDAELRLHEVSRAPDGTSVVIDLPATTAEQLARTLIPEETALDLVASCVRELHVARAREYAHRFALDPRIVDLIEILFQRLLAPMDGIPPSKHLQRLVAAAPAINLVSELRDTLGPIETVTRLAQLLSGACAKRRKDRWPASRQLRPLWNARLAVVRGTDVRMPPDLTAREILSAAAQVIEQPLPSDLDTTSAVEAYHELCELLGISTAHPSD